MSRRARGEGTVLRDGDGWIARIDLPVGPDGKRRRRKRRARTKTEAFKALKELQREYSEIRNPNGLERTVTQAVETFLQTQPTDDRSEHTVYLDRWRGTMIVGGLGHRTLGKLSVQDCDAFLIAVRDGDFGSRTVNRDGVRRTRRLLVRVLQNEIRIGNLSRNVADLSVMPSFGTTGTSKGSSVDEDGDRLDGSRRSLTYTEFHQLRDGASPLVLVAIELIGRNGLRPSEARALRWSRVDLEAMTMRIDRQVSSNDELTETKTKRARRTIPIDAQTAACLRDWRSIQSRRRVPGNRSTVKDLVLSTRHGTPVNRNNLKRSTVAAAKKAGLPPVVPYELRHTAITFQVDAGHDTWEVADWAGTSVRMIEEVYRHRLTRVAKLGPVAPNPEDGR